MAVVIGAILADDTHTHTQMSYLNSPPWSEKIISNYIEFLKKILLIRIDFTNLSSSIGKVFSAVGEPGCPLSREGIGGPSKFLVNGRSGRCSANPSFIFGRCKNAGGRRNPPP